MEQLSIDAFRGSAVYASWVATFRPGEGWAVVHWHRHDGESELCVPGGEVVSGLVLTEMIDVVCAQTALLNDGHRPVRQL